MTGRRSQRCGVIAALALALGLAASWAPELAFARAPSCASVIDVSGSMAGFAAQASGGGFRNLLRTLGSRCGEHFTLGDKLASTSANLTDLAFGDQNTNLGDALQDLLSRPHATRLLILTDNVADTGSRSGADQQRFYRLIKAPTSDFTRVAVMLIRLPFHGPVFGAPKTPGRDYNQPRALALYVLERGRPSGDFATEIEALLKSPPVGLSALTDQSDDRSIGFYPIRLLPFEAGGSALNVTLQGAHRNVQMEDGRLIISRASGDTDTRLDLNLDLGADPRWDFGGLPLTAAVIFPADPRFGAERIEPCRVDPPVLPRRSGGARMMIACHLASAVAGMSAEQRQAVTTGRLVRHGQLQVSLSARRLGLGLGPTLSLWSYEPPEGQADLGRADPAVQGRIFRLKSLLAGMSPQTEVQAAVARIPVEQELSFFRAAPLLGPALILVALAMLAGLLYLASRARTVEVSAAGGERTVKVIRLIGAIHLEAPGGVLLTVWATALGFWVEARGETVTPPVVGPGGGRVRVGRDRRQIDIRVRKSDGRDQMKLRPRRNHRDR